MDIFVWLAQPVALAPTCTRGALLMLFLGVFFIGIILIGIAVYRHFF